MSLNILLVNLVNTAETATAQAPVVPENLIHRHQRPSNG